MTARVIFKHLPCKRKSKGWKDYDCSLQQRHIENVHEFDREPRVRSQGDEISAKEGDEQSKLLVALSRGLELAPGCRPRPWAGLILGHSPRPIVFRCRESFGFRLATAGQPYAMESSAPARRSNGTALQHRRENGRNGIHAAGAALRLNDGTGQYAFICGAPAFLFSEDRLINDIGPRLVAMVWSIEAGLDSAAPLERSQTRTKAGGRVTRALEKTR